MARQFFSRAFLTALTTVLAAPAFAHPGHGKDGGSHEVTHYLTEPMHVAPLAMAAIAGIAAAAFVAWYRRKA